MEKVLVSACLVGQAVRYDGGHCQQEGLVAQWLRAGRVVPFCPEVEGGLPVPRPAAEIRHGDGNAVLAGNARVVRRNGDDVTEAFTHGARLALACCQQRAIRVAVLQDESPSCGSESIHDGSFSGRTITGAGVTAALLRQHGIRVFAPAQVQQAARVLAAAGTAAGDKLR